MTDGPLLRRAFLRGARLLLISQYFFMNIAYSLWIDLYFLVF